MMVMVVGELLGELVVREVTVGDHAVHDVVLLELGEVPVDRADGELRIRRGDVGNGERTPGAREHGHERRRGSA